MKQCSICKIEKSLSDFWKSKKSSDGYDYRCIPCAQLKRAEYRRNFRIKRRLLLDNIKLESGCIDCGYNQYPSVLDFDHRPDTIKDFNIGMKIITCSLERILAEISKCDVVCANCHRIRTLNRRNEHKQTRIRLLVDNIKLENGCMDCGYDRYPSVLDFDHRPDTIKDFSIGMHVWNYPFKKLSAEIAKCDVVCANCHRIRTLMRRINQETSIMV